MSEGSLPLTESDVNDKKPTTAWTRTTGRLRESKFGHVWARWENWQKNEWKGINIPLLIFLAIVALALWWVHPSDLEPHTWQVFVAFLVTILAAVLEPLPMSASCICALGFCTVTSILSTDQVLSGFGNDTVWLVVMAFFIASGFVSSGLGKRICFVILKYLGSTTLGLAYGFCLCEFILAIAIPSSTARAAGILLPIITPLLKEGFDSDPAKGTEKKIGAFLIMNEIVANTSSSVCWLTGGAWNAMMANFCSAVGVNIAWGAWAYSMAPLGIITLIYAPLVVFLVVPPEIKRTPEAKTIANAKLAEMGRMSKQEIAMLCVFIGIIILWIVSSMIEFVPYSTTGVAIMGVSMLLMLGIIDVKKDIVNNSSAWDLFLWFGVLLMIATQLKETGFFQWLAIKINLSSLPAYAAVWICTAVFYVSQYLFASITAHVSAMFPLFLEIMQHANVPMELGCRALAYTTLSGHLTHYTSSSNPPFYIMGYIKMSTWLFQGVVVMICNIVYINTVGWGYWWLLGFW
ncbi:hypothetical protein FOL47_003755 [Perkinsus chesapeaki]|uniref:Uncharacterized protein n=1 Tax=Perkinsus chesapeaki TaxID=330153 RepID=A0A7J6MZG3_PERCH|nr:hypothetical protein FOL47_003755 [Perkinsus chesapeaki]